MVRALDPTTTYVHLGEGPEVTVVPVTDEFWPTIGSRDELQRGRLMTCFPQNADWDTWEMHPEGDEIVMVLGGALTLHLDDDGEVTPVGLVAPQYVVVPKGVWHTADVNAPGSILVITWGEGTAHRPRQ